MDAQNESAEIKVTGMSCEHCVAAVGKAAGSVGGVTEAVVDLKAGIVTVKGTFDQAELVKAIEAAGYGAS